jgi:chromosomal replication initiator protein
MESALKCIKAKTELLKARIDRDLTDGVLDSLAETESSITPAHIRKLVCTYYKIEPGALASKSRKKVHAHPRNIYAFLCRRHTDRTLAGIGKTINRSHSAVLYATELVMHKMKTEKNLEQQVRFLSRKLDEMKHAE